MMLLREPKSLRLTDKNGTAIRPGEVLLYRNPKNPGASILPMHYHKVIYCDARGCWCMLRGDGVVMRIGSRGRWRSERFEVVDASLFPPQP